MAPRDHGKTQQMRARIVFELGRSTIPRLAWRPDLRIKLFKNTHDNAAEIVSQVARDIESNTRLHRLFPKLRPARRGKWTDHKIYIHREANLPDASFEGRGILSSATGGRGDMIFLDDICDLKNSVLEPATRDKILTSLDSVIFNLREPWTRWCAIGTAWHELDANAQLQRRTDDWIWRIDRIQEQPGGPMHVLWPGKWDIPALEESLRNNEREFERGFNNRPFGDKESLVNWEDVRACMDPTIALGEEPWPTRIRVAGYDLAIGKGDYASYFFATVLGRHGSGRLIPLAMIRDRIPFRQQIGTVVNLHKRWHPDYHMVENNVFQEALVEQLWAEHPEIPVEAHTTGKTKMDPYIGLPGLAPLFRNRQIVLPTKGGHDGTDSSCECPMCTFLRELRYFPAGTTDGVMSFWITYSKIRVLEGAAAEITTVESAFEQEFGDAGDDDSGLDADLGI
ncbi:MAG: hypothetical protein OCU12_07085 [Methanophagales archaeon]|nr:hypothetical protein [Methanophagales archaeon]